jgi:hypothetical protein
MTPALRHREADKKPLLLTIWKFLRRENRRSRTSMQMREEPRTQAMPETPLISHPRRSLLVAMMGWLRVVREQ